MLLLTCEEREEKNSEDYHQKRTTIYTQTQIVYSSELIPNLLRICLFVCCSWNGIKLPYDMILCYMWVCRYLIQTKCKSGDRKERTKNCLLLNYTFGAFSGYIHFMWAICVDIGKKKPKTFTLFFAKPKDFLVICIKLCYDIQTVYWNGGVTQ